MSYCILDVLVLWHFACLSCRDHPGARSGVLWGSTTELDWEQCSSHSTRRRWTHPKTWVAALELICAQPRPLGHARKARRNMHSWSSAPVQPGLARGICHSSLKLSISTARRLPRKTAGWIFCWSMHPPPAWVRLLQWVSAGLDLCLTSHS